MEKELRSLKGRGHFPIPAITPHFTRIENPHHIRKTLEAVDEEVVQILTTVRESERTYEKEKEEPRVREQQARATRPSQRPEYNFLSLNSSTPIKNTGTTTGNQNRQTGEKHSLQSKHHTASLLHDWNNQSQQLVRTPSKQFNNPRSRHSSHSPVYDQHNQHCRS